MIRMLMHNAGHVSCLGSEVCSATPVASMALMLLASGVPPDAEVEVVTAGLTLGALASALSDDAPAQN